MPTQLTQDVQLQLSRTDTTTVPEAEILEIYPQDRFAVQVALTELCDHNLLAVTLSARAGQR